MSVRTASVAEILEHHVTLELECIDRMYCNVYVPRLQSPGMIAKFFRDHRGMAFASSALMAPMSHAFVQALLAFARREGAPLVRFEKGARKEDVAAEHLARFTKDEGLLFLGVAQEKTRVFRTEKRRNPATGAAYPWIVPGSAMVNQYYLYALDRDFGLFFLKFSSRSSARASTSDAPTGSRSSSTAASPAAASIPPAGPSAPACSPRT